MLHKSQDAHQLSTGVLAQRAHSNTHLRWDGVHCREGPHNVASLQLYLLALLQDMNHPTHNCQHT
jgi:hypothetical protein